MREDHIDRLIRMALEEDVGSGDLTSRLTVGAGAFSEGIVLARQAGVLAGMSVVERVFLLTDPKVVVTPLEEEGVSFRKGAILAELAGPTKAILAGERVALNFLQHLCGIATLTNRFAREVAGTGATVLDTRKTTPGMREIEKYAVRMGGGKNHRFGLHDGILIKENHIHAAGGISEALERVQMGLEDDDSRFVVVVEAATADQVREAVDAGADRILLDNMSPALMSEMVGLVRRSGRQGVQLEASGGITLKNVREVAETGVDFISIGALTHSAGALDISLLLR